MVWEALLYAPVMFLAILGTAELYRTLSRLGGRKQHTGQAILVLPVRSDCKNLELLLRACVRALEELPTAFGRVAVLDCGMDSEQLRVCELFSRDYSCVSVFSNGDFCDIIEFDYS